MLSIPEDPADKAGLVRAAHQLWSATPGHFDAAAVVDFLGRLAKDLDDLQWRAVSAAAFYAWEQHRGVGPVRPRLSAVNETLISRFVRSGALGELEGLVRVAGANGFDAAVLQVALEKAVAEPLDAWDGSRPAEIVAAALRAGDVPRAAALLEKVRWREGAAEAARAGALRYAAIVALARDGEAGKFDTTAGVREWRGQESDAVGRAALRPLLEKLAVKAVEALSGKSEASIGALLTTSAGEAGAEEFWERVIQRLLPSAIDARVEPVTAVAGLAGAYETRFAKPEFEANAWLRVAEIARSRNPGEPLRGVEALLRAAKAARTDVLRGKIAGMLADGYARALEFAQARAAVETALAAVKDETLKAELAKRAEDLKKKAADDEVRVAKQKEMIEIDRLRGQLQHFRDRLATARQQERPSEEIQAIERTIRDLEKRVPE